MNKLGGLQGRSQHGWLDVWTVFEGLLGIVGFFGERSGWGEGGEEAGWVGGVGGWGGKGERKGGGAELVIGGF